MLSLKKRIDGLDREQQRFEAVRGCFLDTLSGVQEHVVEVTPELAREFRLKIGNLQRELSDSGELSLMEQGRTDAVAALADYKSRSEEALRRKEDDLRGIMDV